MSPDQERLESEIVRVHGKEPLKVLSLLSKLYQHPVLLHRSETSRTDHEFAAQSPKVQWLQQILSQVKKREEKALVFVLHKEMQKLLQDFLSISFGIRVEVVNGDDNSKSPDAARKKIRAFSEAPGFNILLLSPLAAGAGLNIVAANHVIHFFRWWNPAKENQATDRAYRIGQTRPVTVHYAILHRAGSSNEGFDQRLHELIQSKLHVATELFMPTENTKDLASFLKSELEASTVETKEEAA